MRLPDALRKIFLNYGGFCHSGRLFEFLRRAGALDSPFVSVAFASIPEKTLEKLCGAALSGKTSEYQRVSDRALRRLTEKYDISRDFAVYAAESVSYALGLRDSAPELPPDPFGVEENESGAPAEPQGRSVCHELQSSSMALSWYLTAAASA